MKHYKSFAKWNIPESFGYDIAQLEAKEYKIKGRFNKNNPEFQEFCDNLKNDKKELKIIDLDRKNMVDIWVK